LPLDDEKAEKMSLEPSEEDIKDAIKAGEMALGEKDVRMEYFSYVTFTQ
jgi:hypothetical protein